MLFLKNLLLRNFQGCCLLFNYQGSSLFLLIRSSSDILSRRFSLVKNFFIFLFAVCSGFFLPHKSAYLDYHIDFSLSRTFFIFFLLSVPEVFLPHKSALIGYHIRILLSRTFFTLSSDLLSHPVPQRPLGLFFSSVCLSDKWYLITGKVNCQCFFCFLFFSHNSDNLMVFSILKERRTSLLKATSFLC